jgi:hypothetical protein
LVTGTTKLWDSHNVLCALLRAPKDAYVGPIQLLAHVLWLGKWKRKYPDRYPKKFLLDHILLGPLPKLRTDLCALSYYEPTDPKQLVNIATRWMPLVNYSFVPVQYTVMD